MAKTKQSDGMPVDSETGGTWTPSVPQVNLSKINGHLGDFTKAEIIKLAEALAEKALAGEVLGVFQITIGKDGEIQYSNCLVRVSEALGMMEIAKEAILKKFVI